MSIMWLGGEISWGVSEADQKKLKEMANTISNTSKDEVQNFIVEWAQERKLMAEINKKYPEIAFYPKGASGERHMNVKGNEGDDYRKALDALKKKNPDLAKNYIYQRERADKALEALEKKIREEAKARDVEGMKLNYDNDKEYRKGQKEIMIHNIIISDAFAKAAPADAALKDVIKKEQLAMAESGITDGKNLDTNDPFQATQETKGNRLAAPASSITQVPKIQI